MFLKIIFFFSRSSIFTQNHKSQRRNLQQVHNKSQSIRASHRSPQNERRSLQHTQLGNYRTIRLYSIRNNLF